MELYQEYVQLYYLQSSYTEMESFTTDINLFVIAFLLLPDFKIEKKTPPVITGKFSFVIIWHLHIKAPKIYVYTVL